MKKFYSIFNRLLLIASVALTSINTFAQTIYSDEAANYKNGWQGGANGGTGFKPWVINDGSVSCSGWPELPLSLDKNVRLFVTAPSNTPDTASLYVSGNFEKALCGTNDWTGGGGDCLKMNKLQGSTTCFWIDLKLDNNSEFKITRGSWNSVIKSPTNADIANLKWNGQSEQSFTVAKWSDLPAVVTVPLNAGYFIGNPKNDGIGTDGIDTTAFGMWSTGTRYLNLNRKFAAPMNVGDVFTFYWGMNFDAKTGNKGFDFKSGDSTVLNINNGGTATIFAGKDSALKIYGTKPVLVFLTRVSETQYSLDLGGRDSAGTETFTKNFDINLPVDGIDFYIGGQADTDPKRNVYFNKLQLILSEVTAVTNLNAEKGFNVYPNPVAKGGTLQLAFRNRKAGQYTITLFDINGKRVQQSVVGHAGGNAVQRISLDAQLQSGIYFAEVSGNGKRENVKLIVQ
jgi:hypothetical protein